MQEDEKIELEEFQEEKAEDNKEENKVKDFISDIWVSATPEEIESVQVFSRRLVEDYEYDKKQIQTRPQFNVRKSPSDERKSYPVDIAVFGSDEKTESNLFMIVECKQPKKKEGLRQLKIYMDLSPAKIGIWFNGKEHAYIRKVQKSGGIIEYVEIPNIPKKDQRIEDVGKFKRKDLKPTKNLKIIFRDIRNHLAQKATGITRDETMAREIINLLFCKIFDELNTAPEEVMAFRSGIDESAKEIAKRIRNLFDNVVKKEYFDVFESNEKIELDDESISYVVGELQNYCLTESERDAIGEAFEVFISPALKGGQGQFFTPRNIVKMAIKILDPSQDDLIIDPACGSGGFLIVALEHVWDRIKAEGESRGFSEKWALDKQKAVAQKMIRGIDKDSFLAKVTKSYMAIIGDGRSGVFCENSLLQPEEWENKTRDKISLGNFSILTTNPPFGSKISVKEKDVLEKYELGCVWKKKEKGRVWDKTNRLHQKQPPQILFIERCLEFLDDGGKMAMVLPDGVLGGSKLGYIAGYIRNNAKIIGLIDCPKETFQPFTPTKTHIVILQKVKDKKELKRNYEIFMAIVNTVGHDRKGRPIFKIDEKGNKILDDGTIEVVNQYEKLKNIPNKKNFTHQGYMVNSRWLENYIMARRYLPEYIQVLEDIESSKEEIKSLEEISTSIITGANITAEFYKQGGEWPYIMTGCVTPLGFNPAELKFVSKESYEYNKTKSVKEGDILINRAGNPGMSCIVPKDVEGALVCGFTFRVRLKKEYDPYYVIAFLNSEKGIRQMERIAFGSTLDHITKDDLENIKIVLPKKSVREKISENLKKATELQVKARNTVKGITEMFE